MTNIWRPTQSVENNRVLDLNRGNPFSWKYTIGRSNVFPDSGTIKLWNTYGQLLGTWDGEVDIDGRTLLFDEPVSVTDAIPAGSSWQLFAEIDGATRLLAQGVVTRSEAPFPDAPAQSSEFDGVRYQYSFGTPGLLYDPSWRILDGHPRVYDNSARNLPNAVAAGSLLAGDFAVFDDVAMLWYAPLRTDSVRLTYNTIRSRFDSDGNGSMWVVICSNYDMTSWAGFLHTQVWGSNDSLSVVTGDGPTSFDIRATASGNTGNNSYYTAEYNPLTDTYTLYLGSNAVVSWSDATNVVDHGPGNRYVGFGFRSDFLQPGVQVSDWIIGDAP